MTHTIMLWLEDAVKTFFFSMLPVIEIRGGIPFGMALGLNPVESYLISILGNMLPIPFLILAGRHIIKWMETHGILSRFTKLLKEKANSHSGITFWGLCFFVAIPLPGTGAWTGGIIASILGIPMRWSLLAISLGVLIAGLIVTGASCGVFALISLI